MEKTRKQAITRSASILLIVATLLAGVSIYYATVYGMGATWLSTPLLRFTGVAAPVVLFHCQGNQTIQNMVENGKNISSVDGRNDLNCFDGVSCLQTIDTSPAVGLFVKVVSDSGARLNGSGVDVFGQVSFKCDSGGAANRSPASDIIGKFSLYNVSSTDPSDPIAINPYGVGNYSLDLVLSNRTYTINMQRPSGSPELVTLSVPSGRVQVAENFTCVCTIVGLETPYSLLQTQFSQGGYDFAVSKSANYTTFDISNSRGQIQTMKFYWTTPEGAASSLPSPATATAFNGNITMNWWLGASRAELDIHVLTNTMPCANDTAY